MEVQHAFGDDEENEGPRQVYFYPRDRRRLRILRCHAKTRESDSSAVIGLFGRIVRETRRESGRNPRHDQWPPKLHARRTPRPLVNLTKHGSKQTLLTK